MSGTKVVALFLQRRLQPAMSRRHPLWKYTGINDQTRISADDFLESELRDEVRCLTCFSQKDVIAMTSVHLPFGIDHLPSEVYIFQLLYSQRHSLHFEFNTFLSPSTVVYHRPVLPFNTRKRYISRRWWCCWR
jgi:hypothetical protein